MSTIQAQILDAVGERLLLPSTERGYHNTVIKVERARVTPFRDFDLPGINYWADTDSLEDTGAGWTGRSLSILIDARSRTRDRPFVDVAYELAEDLWTALWRSPQAPAVSDDPSARLGGIVRHVQLDSITPAIGQGQAPFCGVLLALSVHYRVSAGAPSSILLP